MTTTRLKRSAVALAIGASLALAGGAAQAAQLIGNATLGLYNNGIGTVLNGTDPAFPAVGDPSIDLPAGSPPDLSAAAASLGDWLTNPAAPGGTWSPAPQAIPSTWTVGTETAIIYELDGGAAGLDNVQASFGIDNGIMVWLNGAFLGGQLRPGGAVLGEFTLDIGSVGAGVNYLQILREDHGGGTGYRVDVTGDVAPIPLPATGLLLVGALGGIAAARRVKKRA